LAIEAPPFLTHTSMLNWSAATSVRTSVSKTCSAGTACRTADRKIPWGTLPDHPAASGTNFLPLAPFSALRPLTSTVNEWLIPGLTTLVTSKTDGVNDVVWVPTTVLSTVKVAW
jgi:hypothetical protein